MGKDEILPISGGCRNYWGGLGMMVIESIDTLLLMDLKEEYSISRTWVADHLSFDLDHFTSVFETSIRMLGGLLSAYALTSDSLYIEKAVELQERLNKSYRGPIHWVLRSLVS